MAFGVHTPVRNSKDSDEFLSNAIKNQVLFDFESPTVALNIRSRLAEPGVLRKATKAHLEQPHVGFRLEDAPFGNRISPNFLKILFRCLCESDFEHRLQAVRIDPVGDLVPNFF